MCGKAGGAHRKNTINKLIHRAINKPPLVLVIHQAAVNHTLLTGSYTKLFTTVDKVGDTEKPLFFKLFLNFFNLII